MVFCKLSPGQIAEVVFIETIEAAPVGNNVTDRLKRSAGRGFPGGEESPATRRAARAGHMPGIVLVPCPGETLEAIREHLQADGAGHHRGPGRRGHNSRRGRTGLEGIEAQAEIHSRRIADQSGRLRARAVTALSGQPGGAHTVGGRARGGLPYGCLDAYHRVG